MGIKVVVLLALVFMVAVFSKAPSDKVVFLDVGQGDAIFIQSGIQQVLVDGGPGAAVLEQLAKHMPTFDRVVDVLILTHPQQDHLEGLLHMLSRYQVKLVLLPNAAAQSGLFQSFLQQLEDKHIPYRFAWAGQEVTVGEAKIHVLAPFDTATARAITRTDINNASTAVRVDMHGISFFLSGDAEQVAEQLLITNTQPDLLDIDVLKAGHHGSNTSTHQVLLDATRPVAAVISVGKDNQFGHPHLATLQRLAGLPVFRTDEHGAVSFFYDGAAWRYAVEK